MRRLRATTSRAAVAAGRATATTAVHGGRRRAAPWALLLLLAVPPAVAGAAEMGLPEPPAGGVDWVLRRIVAEGVGLAPANWDGMMARRAASERMARADLAARLLAQVGELQVEGTDAAGRAGARLAASPALHRAVLARLGRAQEVSARFFSDGGVSLRAALPLEAVADLLIHGPGGAPAGRTPAAPVEVAGGYTGLAIDAQGSGFVPCLRVIVRDPRGETLFDAARVVGDEVALAGPVAFVRQTSQALRQTRLGARPLWRQATVQTGAAGAAPLVVESIDAATWAGLEPLLEGGHLVVVW